MTIEPALFGTVIMIGGVTGLYIYLRNVTARHKRERQRVGCSYKACPHRMNQPPDD